MIENSLIKPTSNSIMGPFHINLLSWLTHLWPKFSFILYHTHTHNILGFIYFFFLLYLCCSYYQLINSGPSKFNFLNWSVLKLDFKSQNLLQMLCYLAIEFPCFKICYRHGRPQMPIEFHPIFFFIIIIFV